MRLRRIAGMAALALAWGAAAAQEPAFDASAFEKKPVEIGGYAELKQEHFALHPEGTLYRLGTFGGTGRRHLDRTSGTLQLAGKLRHDSAAFEFRTNSALRKDATGEETDNAFYEAFASLRPGPQATLEAGKRALRWGKGYAWNPIGFVERAKDPDDPNLAREGFWMLDGDFVYSPGGAVQTVAVTPVLLPVSDAVNGDFGARGHLNPAVKLYLLVHDVDVDLAWQAAGSRPGRFGFDFSTNLKTNFEVHGEWARVGAAPRLVTDAAGQLSTRVGPATSWLLGMRYLTERDTTWIAEYFHNGGGYTRRQLEDFSLFADAAFAQAVGTGNASQLQKARMLAQAGYGRPNPGRDYVYLRAQQKDALGIVYFQPALTAIANLEDRSWQLTPQLQYTGWRNTELRARLYWLQGSEGSDFGEKQNRRRIELYLRHYF